MIAQARARNRGDVAGLVELEQAAQRDLRRGRDHVRELAQAIAEIAARHCHAVARQIAEGAGKARTAVEEPRDAVAPVAGEDIVAAGAAHQHLDAVGARLPADALHEEGRDVAVRLVEIEGHGLEILRATAASATTSVNGICQRRARSRAKSTSLPKPSAAIEAPRKEMQ